MYGLLQEIASGESTYAKLPCCHTNHIACIYALKESHYMFLRILAAQWQLHQNYFIRQNNKNNIHNWN